MAGPYARCPKGHVFEVTNLVGGGGTIHNLVIGEGNTAGCWCGAKGRIIEGTYTYINEVIRLTSLASNVSGEDRAAVQGFLSALRERDTAPTPDEIDSDYGDVNPAMRDIFKRLVQNVPWSIVLAIVSLIFSTVYATALSDATDANVQEVRDAVERLHEREDANNADATRDREAIIRYLDDASRRMEEPPRSTQPTSTQRTSPRANPKGTRPRPSDKKRKPR